MRYTLLALLVLGGCRALPSDDFVDPIPTGDAVALREAAIVSEAKAQAYNRLADEAAGRWERLMEGAQEAAQGLGAPAVLTGLLGAAGGWMIPTPAQRRRERLAASEARSGGPTDRPSLEPRPDTSSSA